MGVHVARCRWRSRDSRLASAFGEGCVRTQWKQMEEPGCPVHYEEEGVCITKIKGESGRTARELNYLLCMPDPLETRYMQASGPGPLFLATM